MQTLAILLFILAAGAQRVETQHADSARVTRVETAMNHLTIIELAEPVTLAAAGSPSFKVERRENKVFIQPLEEGASTNLFVWTASGRWNYELIPASSVETMHFAIDQEIDAPRQTQNGATPPESSTSLQSLAEEMLLFGKPIRNAGLTVPTRGVGVFITDVYRKDDKLFVRYVIDNHTTQAYTGGVPEVFALNAPQSQRSIQTMRYSQVGREIERKIRSSGRTRIPTVDCDVPAEPLPPGETATGILILEAPSSLPESQPAVLRFTFPRAGQKPIVLTLIL
jgi:Flp pilus assembly secretin CpaC